MITERKLRSLRSVTRLRKIARLLREFEVSLRAGVAADPRYVEMLIAVAGELVDVGDVPAAEGTDAMVRRLNTVRGRIAQHVGDDPAEWDLLPPRSERTVEPAGGGNRGVTGMRVYLEDLRSPFNVGAVFRTAAAFSVDELVLSADTASPDHPRAVRSAMGTIAAVRWRRETLEQCLDDGVVFALEGGGTPIEEFHFPERGMVVIGNEELGISPDARRWCRTAGGIVSIPLPGPKASLNVAVAFGVLVHRWHEAVARSRSPTPGDRR